MEITFTKMNGAGNDFVVIDNRAGKYDELDATTIEEICARHSGVGADGLLMVDEPAEGSTSDYRFRYFNSDGGEAEMCGNGARCFARFARNLHRRNLADEVTFDTIVGQLRATFPGDEVCINMTEPFDLRENITLDLDGETLSVHFINTGVPHVVLPVDDVETVDIAKIGHSLRYHNEFAPAGTNANIFSVIEPGHIRARTYERGVEAETLACGTGVVANAIIHHLLTGAQAPISVDVRGGDTLKVNFHRDSDGAFQDVELTGPANFVFTGEISI